MKEPLAHSGKSYDKEINLLYSQTIELQKLYYQTIYENDSRTSKYYLLPKKWLDNLKSKYNYSSIIQGINILDCHDYNYFREILLKNKENNKYNNNFINEINTIENNIEKETISKYSINYPINFVPVKPDIFENLNKKLLYDLIIGEGNIFIFDNDKQHKNQNIFICSINSNENTEDISDFSVNVDSILILKEKKRTKERNKFIKYISENKGIKNYFKQRKIDANKIGEQIVYNNEDEEVAIFYKIKNKEENQTPNSFIEEYIKKIYSEEKEEEKEGKSTTFCLKEIYGNKFKVIQEKKENKNINKINENKIINQSEGNIKKPKLITINGDIYFYLKRHGINNSFVYIFNENLNNNSSYNNNNSCNGYQYNNQ